MQLLFEKKGKKPAGNNADIIVIFRDAFFNNIATRPLAHICSEINLLF